MLTLSNTPWNMNLCLVTLAQYFTFWSWVLMLLPVYTPWKRATAVLVSIGGAYLTYVYPRSLQFPTDHCGVPCLSGAALRVIDAVMHHLPLLFFMRIWWSDHKRTPFVDTPGFLLALAFWIVYAGTHSLSHIYGLRPVDVLVVGCVTMLTLILLLTRRGATAH